MLGQAHEGGRAAREVWSEPTVSIWGSLPGSEGGTEPACGVRGLSLGRAVAGVQSRGAEQGYRARTRAVPNVPDNSFQKLQDTPFYM